MHARRPRIQLDGKNDVFYVVVHADGKVMASLYPKLGRAMSVARRDGDTVIPVQIDLTKEPVFIRTKVLKP